MAVKIRLTRRGRKNLPLYDIVISNSRSPRDGRFIEKIGTYNTTTNPSTVILNEDKALEWLLKGAQPTDTVNAILSNKGILLKKHLQVGVIKGAITQEIADARLEEWKTKKEAKKQSKIDAITVAKDTKLKASLESEALKNKARRDAILTKKKEAEVKLTQEIAQAEVPESEKEMTEQAQEAVETETQENKSN